MVGEYAFVPAAGGASRNIDQPCSDPAQPRRPQRVAHEMRATQHLVSTDNCADTEAAADNGELVSSPAQHGAKSHQRKSDNRKNQKDNVSHAECPQRREFNTARYSSMDMTEASRATVSRAGLTRARLLRRHFQHSRERQ